VIHYGSTGVALRLSFEWDEEKAKENYRKHEVSFEEGSTVLSDPSLSRLTTPTIRRMSDAILISVVLKRVASWW
jgi:uncharacterized DUF497 family protein